MREGFLSNRVGLNRRRKEKCYEMSYPLPKRNKKNVNSIG